MQDSDDYIPADEIADAAFFCGVTDEEWEEFSVEGLGRFFAPPGKRDALEAELRKLPLPLLREDVITVIVARAIALQRVVWAKGDTFSGNVEGALRLGIGFLDGTAAEKDFVLIHAAEWTGPGKANVRFFRQDDLSRADVRVTFTSGQNTSVKGNEARQRPQNQPTAQLSDVRASSNQTRRKFVVRHEFGHVLGLSHEQTHYNSPFDFNEDFILRGHGNTPGLLGQRWGNCHLGEQTCRESIRNFITRRLPESGVIGTAQYDWKSIMAYPIPKDWLNTGSGTGENNAMSGADLAVVAALYP